MYNRIVYFKATNETKWREIGIRKKVAFYRPKKIYEVKTPKECFVNLCHIYDMDENNFILKLIFLLFRKKLKEKIKDGGQIRVIFEKE